MNGIEDFLLCCPCTELQFYIQSIEFEEISMGWAPGRAWAAIADLAKIVSSLFGASLDYPLRRHPLC